MKNCLRAALGVATLLFTAAAAAQECELRGARTLGPLIVRAPGSEPIALNVHDAEVIVEPTESEWHSVEVRAGLAFDAVSEDIDYRLARRVQTGHGMVSLSLQARVDTVRAFGVGIRLTAHLALWASVRGLEVGCQDIQVSSPEQGAEAPSADTSPALPDTDGTYWRPVRRRLEVRAEPGSGPRIRVELSDVPFILERVESRGGWYLVHWSGGGNTLDGWVRRSALRSAHRHAWGRTGGGGGETCVGGGAAFRQGLYRGPAELVPGATVRDAPSGVAWASVRASSGVIVMHDRGAAWAQLIRVDGVSEVGHCQRLFHAWVRIEDVRLPEDAESRRMVSSSPSPSEPTGPSGPSGPSGATK